MVTAFGNYEGAAIAMDPRSGDILGMVSLPSYDPNLFVNGISHADFKALNDNPSRPQFNRLVLGGVAGLHAQAADRAGRPGQRRAPAGRQDPVHRHVLPGVSRGWGDSHRGGHGWTDMRKSIAQSVNTYYYKLALDLGITRFDDTCASSASASRPAST
jgi:penicillin-binding protein 2